MTGNQPPPTRGPTRQRSMESSDGARHRRGDDGGFRCLWGRAMAFYVSDHVCRSLVT
ncbi:hypothetical protein Hdeb2414_s0003g00092221 [Helianthus debilis subsp. tardiflorus]